MYANTISEKTILRPILSIRDLKVYFYTYAGVVKALDGISLDVFPQETLGLVGETGCGKSVTALAILKLIDRPGRIDGGEVIFEGENLLEKTEDEMRKIRGHKIAMIFQDPTTYFNPVLTIGEQIAEAIREYRRMNVSNVRAHSKVVEKEVVEALRNVGMPDPERIAKHYPHELSTGMKQRAMIAMMTSFKPKLLIADEATTALDVTVQAQVLTLLERLKKEMGLSVLFITHNFGIVAEFCDRVAVMYSGTVVEVGKRDDIFDDPLHPYTNGLLKSVIKPGVEVKKLVAIPGSVPDLINPPSGCRFHPRCHLSKTACTKERPHLSRVKEDHFVSCHLFT